MFYPPAMRFPIGTQYIKRVSAKVTRDCTVVDYEFTFNSRGELVRSRYVSTHEFCGQLITERDIVETTIARSLFAEAKKVVEALEGEPVKESK
jgi:hypothetical protein